MFKFQSKADFYEYKTEKFQEELKSLFNLNLHRFDMNVYEKILVFYITYNLFFQSIFENFIIFLCFLYQYGLWVTKLLFSYSWATFPA